MKILENKSLRIRQNQVSVSKFLHLATFPCRDLYKQYHHFCWDVGIRLFDFTHFIEASTIKGGSGQGVLKAQTMGKDDYIFLDERYNVDGKKKRDEKEV